jgi:hypothetical protein
MAVNQEARLSMGRRGGPPARLVRVKRALTNCHGKSHLPYPRWLLPGPPHRWASGRGRNGAYGMSGTNPVGDNGKAGADGKDGQARTCNGREHVGRQLKGANLTPFFSKNTPKLPFLAEEAQMNF